MDMVSEITKIYRHRIAPNNLKILCILVYTITDYFLIVGGGGYVLLAGLTPIKAALDRVEFKKDQDKDYFQ